MSEKRPKMGQTKGFGTPFDAGKFFSDGQKIVGSEIEINVVQETRQNLRSEVFKYVAVHIALSFSELVFSGFENHWSSSSGSGGCTSDTSNHTY